jgi:UDP-glucose 4-epimerase
MRVLVTGGAGFIGPHLTDRLVADAHDVVVIDNESTGLRTNVPPEAKYVKGNVAMPSELAPAFEKFGHIDAVCHIAGHCSLIGSFTDPLRDLRSNTEGKVNVLMQCLQQRIGRVLYASSMTVYGGRDAVCPREDAPLEPISYYGITEHAGERYVHATAMRPDLLCPMNVTSFRMYSVYGPRQALENPYQGVLGIFLGNLQRGEPIRVFGDGEQSRDFVYVADVVDAWARALEDPRTYGEIFNVGSGHSLTINALVDHAPASFGKRREGNVVHELVRPGEQRKVEVAIAKVKDVMGWEPRTPFDRGLAEMVCWARSGGVAR